ncbi:hypothetical protein KW463_16780 [Vibrio fluvialis]|nr:hypothetical protein [Vibrio fluvialis]
MLFSGYGVMRNLGSCVVCPLSGRYINYRQGQEVCFRKKQ